MTTIINFLGGPGISKSSSAGKAFVELKKKNVSVEFVQEYVKEIVWQGIKPTAEMQIFYFAEQLRREYVLMNKVDYVVTDSPSFMSVVYNKKYNGCEDFNTLAIKTYKWILEKHNIKIVNILLQRCFAYEQDGRIETEQQAIVLDKQIEQLLIDNDFEYVKLSPNDVESYFKEI